MDASCVSSRRQTDLICYRFSVPVFVASVALYLSVVYFGNRFSFLHPSDSSGLFCGVNNTMFSEALGDYSDLPFLSAKGSCSADCANSSFFGYCFDGALPISHKIAAEIRQYLIFTLFILLVAFPLMFAFLFLAIYFINAVFTGVILMVLGLFVYSAFNYSIYATLALSMVFLLLSILYHFIHAHLAHIRPLLTYSISILGRDSLAVPFFLLFVDVAAIAFGVTGCLFANGVAEPVALSRNRLKLERHMSLSSAVYYFPILALWIINYFSAWTRTAIAHSVSEKYYKHSSGRVIDSFDLINRYHSGTLFFGSLALLLFDALSSFIAYIEYTANQSKSTIVRFLSSCILSAFFLIVGFVKEINRLAFTFTGMNGSSFWDGCRAGQQFIATQGVMGIEVAIRNIFLSCKVLASVISSFICIAFMGDFYFPVLPAILLPLFVYLCLGCLQTVIIGSFDTVLACLVIDAQENSNTAPEELRHYFSHLTFDIKNELP